MCIVQLHMLAEYFLSLPHLSIGFTDSKLWSIQYASGEL